MDPYLSPQLGGLGGDGMGPVLGNPNMLAQAIAARRQPRPQLSGPATGAELAQNLGMVPGLGLLGVGGDIAQYIDKPETRGWLPYALTAAGAIPFLGALAKMAGPLPKGILKSQAGAIAYHGSPHQFAPTPNNPLGEFSASKIGTGEGAQAYGHGTYLAEAENVGKIYQNNLAKPDFSKTADGLALRGRVPEMLDEAYEQVLRQSAGPVTYRDAADLVGKKLDQQRRDALKAGDMNWFSQVVEMEGDLSRFVKAPPKPKGHLYKADIPDEWLPKMLDWDKPLSQQPAPVKDAVNRVARDPRFAVNRVSDDMRPSEIQQLFQNPAAAQELKRLGVPGIRYLDGGSRSGGQGTSNYVVFPGMEKQVKILSRE